MLPATLVALALLVPAQAASASPLAVHQDCGDSDVFEQKHSRADLQAALRELPADLNEYGECKRMIQAALAAMAKKADKPGGPGGIDAASADLDGDGVVSPAEKRVAIEKAKRQRKERNQQLAAIGDDLVQDDAAAATGGDGGSGGTPLPLILTLVALVCAGVGGGLWYASKRNPAVANALSRVPLPFRNS
jgi:hypothetical protein